MAVSYPDRSMQRMDVLSSFRWSAIFAGLIAALATQLFLASIGAALGISATAVAEGAARGLGIGAGIFMVISPLISMFIGGMVSVWLARPADRSVALMHGALVWCLSLVAGAFLVGSIASSAFSGVLSTAGAAVSGLAAGDPSARDRLRIEIEERRAQAGSEVAETAANVGTGVAWASVFAMALSFGSALFGANVAYKRTYAPIRPELRPERPREGVTAKPREEARPIVTPTGKEIRPGDEYRPDLH